MIRFLALLLSLAAATPALAASSRWQTSEGGAVRLVTSGLPDAEGRLRGALDIRLEPGWKTYWRNPGQAGIPPQIDTSGSANLRSAEIGFPPPLRFHDGDAVWAGYDRSVRLPVTFILDRADAVTLIEVEVMLGICETICIPFQASFAFDPGADADNRADALAVQTAFAALPAPATDAFGVSGAKRVGARLAISATLPPAEEAPELFIDHKRGHLLGTPVLTRRTRGGAEFVVEIFAAEEVELARDVLNYTLVVGGRAVTGNVELR